MPGAADDRQHRATQSSPFVVHVSTTVTSQQSIGASRLELAQHLHLAKVPLQDSQRVPCLSILRCRDHCCLQELHCIVRPTLFTARLHGRPKHLLLHTAESALEAHLARRQFRRIPYYLTPFYDVIRPQLLYVMVVRGLSMVDLFQFKPRTP